MAGYHVDEDLTPGQHISSEDVLIMFTVGAGQRTCSIYDIKSSWESMPLVSPTLPCACGTWLHLCSPSNFLKASLPPPPRFLYAALQAGGLVDVAEYYCHRNIVVIERKGSRSENESERQ